MNLAAGGLVFLAWLGYGSILFRKSAKWRRQFALMPANRRIRSSMAAMIASAIWMLAGLYAIGALGWFPPTGPSTAGWFAILVVGVGFVHGQTWAAAAMFSLVRTSEPTQPAQPSEQEESKSSET